MTGASRGIGRAIARRLATAGFHVVVNHRASAEQASAVVQELTEMGATAEVIQADVTDPAETRRLISSIRQRHGRLDVLINNAGRREDGFLLLMPPERWWRVFEDNVAAVVNCTRAALPLILAARPGAIVNISSLSGVRGTEGQTAYSAAKASVIGFTKALARELAPKRVAVNCVAPGPIQTEMYEMGSQEVPAEARGDASARPHRLPGRGGRGGGAARGRQGRIRARPGDRGRRRREHLMRVAVTGLAIWCSLGRTLSEFEAGLREGRSGRRPVTRFDVSHRVYRTRAAAVLADEDAIPAEVDETRLADLALVVAREALLDAGLRRRGFGGTRHGMALGTSHGGHIALMKFVRGRLGLSGGRLEPAAAPRRPPRPWSARWPGAWDSGARPPPSRPRARRGPTRSGGRWS